MPRTLAALILALIDRVIARIDWATADDQTIARFDKAYALEGRVRVLAGIPDNRPDAF